MNIIRYWQKEKQLQASMQKAGIKLLHTYGVAFDDTQAITKYKEIVLIQNNLTIFSEHIY